MSVYVTIDVLYKNFYKRPDMIWPRIINGHDAWITIYQEKVRRGNSLIPCTSWTFTMLAVYSNILLQLSDIVNGIEKNEQLALLYVNHEVDVIRQMAMAIVKYGPRGVNITYNVVSGSGMLA